MKNCVFLHILLISVSAFSQTDTSIVKFRNPSTVSAVKGYSHAVEVDMGNFKMVIISGQVPLDTKGELIGKNDLAKQTEQVFLNISNIVAASGGTMNDIVRIGIFMTDITQVQTFRDVRNRFINLRTPPVSTLVQVSRLFRDDVLIEGEATAIISKKSVQ